MAETSLSRGVDLTGVIRQMVGDLHGPRTAIYELIQNADDAPGATRMRFTVTGDALEVWNDAEFGRCDNVTTDECLWLTSGAYRCDFHSFRKMASGDKRNRPGTTGAFGIGFTAVYQFTDRPELQSNGEHWVLVEPDRIETDRTRASQEGTTFRLPWATEQSAFRSAIGHEAMSRMEIATVTEEIFDAVPEALPFLKHLTGIEISDGSRTRLFARRHEGDRVAVVSEDGESNEWFLLTGEFDDAAAILKARHPEAIEPARSSQVTVALPTRESTSSGLLYTTLPSEESTHLPLLVDAEFIPASDRKRVRFDDAPAGAWNRAAVQAAARLLGREVERLSAALGDSALVRLLLDARGLAEKLGKERIDRSFGHFWDSLREALATAEVVPTQAGGYGKVDAVRLWSDPAEGEAALLLHELGIELVKESVKNDWYGLRREEVAIQELHLSHLVGALRAAGLDRKWFPAGASGVVQDEQRLRQLWSLVDVLLGSVSRSSRESRAALEHCAVAPGWDGALLPIGEVYRTDQESQDLFADLGLTATFLDLERLDDLAPRLVELVGEATPHLVLGWMEEAFRGKAEVAEDDRGSVLTWFHERRSLLDEQEDLERLAELPIFPTASGRRPLKQLVLPVDHFEDPLGLARVVAGCETEDMRPFLRKLGAKHLTFATYCVDYVPAAVSGGELTDDRRLALVQLLASRFSEIRDNDAVLEALLPLDLVRCTDGRWRPGEEVYLSSEVRSVLGASAHLADLPTDKPGAHEDLYRWLGATAIPRPADVETRCRHLIAGPADHSEVAQRIVQHVGQRFKADETKARTDFARLQEIGWLPVQGRPRGHRPRAVFTPFQKKLFASQGDFVDLPIRLQQNAVDFLTWLGVRSDPEPDQVVDHLLWCAQRGEQVRGDMWQYLNTHADHPALDKLRDQRCLLLDTGDYVRPDQVYWGWHPFGRHRHMLAGSIRKHRALLDRLEVAEHPHPRDAVEVLLDIAARHAGEKAPLLGEDIEVVHACWQLLSSGLAEDAIGTRDFLDLQSAEVVLDGRWWLRRPGDVFFRDSERLAARFDQAITDRLIDRPEASWVALAAAGVKNLSDAVTTHIVEQGASRTGGDVVERLGSRQRLLLRVLDTEVDPDAIGRLSRLGFEVDLCPVTSLRIQQTVELDGAVHTSAPYDRGALYQPDNRTLLYVESEGTGPVWVEIARELMRAFEVDGARSSSVASAIKGVLSAATDETAVLELDELGFAALDVEAPANPVPAVANELGGASADEHNDDEDGLAPLSERETSERSSTASEDAATRLDVDSQGEEAISAGSSNAGSDGPAQASGRHAGVPLDGGGGELGPAGGEPHPHRSSRRPATSRATGQSRLRSYVVPAKASAEEGETYADDIEHDAAVERAGVEAVLEYERVHGRLPTEMPPGNPGFDVRSEDPSGHVRVIEVKACRDRWGLGGVALSSTQFEAAQGRREDFWLYVVEDALTSPQVHPVNDPVTKVDQYVFDDGWRVVAETAEPEPAPVPDLQLPGSPDGMAAPVPLHRSQDPKAPASDWVDCGDPAWRADWFAVRIVGESLGLKNIGGIAVVEPIEREAEEDEVVLAVLHDQIDPDSSSRVSLRVWSHERDLHGNRLALRLRSRGGVEPLTVAHPDRLVLRGVVRRVLSVAELDELGYYQEEEPS